jgi:hypothetical protein
MLRDTGICLDLDREKELGDVERPSQVPEVFKFFWYEETHP